MEPATEDQLRLELADVKKRFDDWKQRAKTAVEKEREKFVELSHRNEELQRENETLTSSSNALRSEAGTLRSDADRLTSELEQARQKEAITTGKLDDWKQRAKSAVEKEREKFAEISQQNDALRQDNERLASTIDAMRTEMEALRGKSDRLASDLSHATEREAAAIASYNNELFSEKDKHIVELEKLLASEQQLSQQLRNDIEGISRSAMRTFTYALDVSLEAASFVFSKSSMSEESNIANLNATIAIVNVAATEANANLERHRRNLERTVRLATRDQDGAKAEADAVRIMAKELEEEVVTQRNAVHQRDLAIAALERQLEEAVGNLQQFESDTFTSANQGHAIADLQQRVLEMEREFSDRELILHENHRDEVDRLLSKHDDEITHVRTSLEDQIRDLTFELDNKNAGGGGGGYPMGVFSDDAAYDELLNENAKLRNELNETIQSRSEVQRDLLAARERLARFDVPASAPGGFLSLTAGSRSHTDTSQMDPQLMRRKIYDLEKQVTSMTEQLLQVNQELIEYRANAKEKQQAGHDDHSSSSSTNSPMGSNQQHVYMKAILVKMLSARTDDVKASLLPVVSTLVKFSNEELKAIYSANPNWIQ